MYQMVHSCFVFVYYFSSSISGAVSTGASFDETSSILLSSVTADFSVAGIPVDLISIR